MLFTRISLTKLKSSIFSITKPLHLLQQQEPIYIYIQKCNYVEVTMKWKKDAFYDSIGIVHKSQDLRPLISLKNCILEEPNGCIPISAISKRGLEFGISEKVASFFRRYPSVFEEYVGPQYNLPWFRLTQEAILLDEEERRVYQDRKGDIVDRLKKFILMSEEKKLPLKIIQGMQWYLGVPDEFLKNLESNLDESFSFIAMEEGLIGLCVRTNEKVLSVMQKNALKKGEYVEGPMAPLAVPLFPSKGLRLKRKISNWLDEFQKLPYVSPYEDCSCLNHNSDIFEKRVVGVLHELLSLFVDHSAERKKLFCLRPYLGLPQKFYKAFARHPHTFYLSLKNKTCTAILKEAYNDNSAMETHPILEVRQKYIRLMDKSGSILRNKRQRKEPGGRDSESNEESECQTDSKSSEESKCRPRWVVTV